MGTAGGLAAGAVGGAAWKPAGPSREVVSYSQMGEDLVVESIFEMLEITPKRYLDIGAADPIVFNNTYRLYRRGLRGVLVEPNPTRSRRAPLGPTGRRRARGRDRDRRTRIPPSSM